MMRAISPHPLPPDPDTIDFRNREVVLNHALLESVECKAGIMQQALIKHQREIGICQYTLVLKDE